MQRSLDPELNPIQHLWDDEPQKYKSMWTTLFSHFGRSLLFLSSSRVMTVNATGCKDILDPELNPIQHLWDDEPQKYKYWLNGSKTLHPGSESRGKPDKRSS